MGNVFDIDGPPQVIAAAAQYYDAIADGTARVSTALSNVRYVPLTGSSPLDVAGAGLRTVAIAPIADRLPQTDSLAGTVLDYTVAKATEFGAVDVGNGVRITQAGVD